MLLPVRLTKLQVQRRSNVVTLSPSVKAETLASRAESNGQVLEVLIREIGVLSGGGIVCLQAVGSDRQPLAWSV